MELTGEQKFYADIVQKAWDDAEFKKELIANPLEAIEKATGVKFQLPAGKKLVVRDQTNESTIYINIPASNENEDVELSEEQLEDVAGGVAPGGCIIYPFPPTDWPPIFTTI